MASVDVIMGEPSPAAVVSSTQKGSIGADVVVSGVATRDATGVRAYYTSKLDELEITIRDKTQNLRRLEAQRNALNSRGASQRETLTAMTQ